MQLISASVPKRNAPSGVANGQNELLFSTVREAAEAQFSRFAGGKLALVSDPERFALFRGFALSPRALSLILEEDALPLFSLPEGVSCILAAGGERVLTAARCFAEVRRIPCVLFPADASLRGTSEEEAYITLGGKGALHRLAPASVCCDKALLMPTLGEGYASLLLARLACFEGRALAAFGMASSAFFAPLTFCPRPFAKERASRLPRSFKGTAKKRPIGGRMCSFLPSMRRSSKRACPAAPSCPTTRAVLFARAPRSAPVCPRPKSTPSAPSRSNASGAALQGMPKNFSWRAKGKRSASRRFPLRPSLFAAGTPSVSGICPNSPRAGSLPSSAISGFWTLQLLDSTDAFLFDLDGTVYLDETPIGDVKGTLARLRALKKRVVFVTNNSSKTEEEYRKKLSRIGILGEGDLIYTSAMAAAEHVSAHFPNKRVFLLATDAVKEEFARTVPLVEDAPDVVILAYDTSLTFAKLKRFNEFLAGGAYFIATHPDAVCPTEGVPMPDVGSFLELFYVSSGRRPDLVVGKPNTVMGESLERRLHIPRTRMCMVGDRLHTDIRFGNNCSMRTVLVLSGETTEETRKNYPDEPTLVLPDVNALL